MCTQFPIKGTVAFGLRSGWSLEFFTVEEWTTAAPMADRVLSIALDKCLSKNFVYIKKCSNVERLTGFKLMADEQNGLKQVSFNGIVIWVNEKHGGVQRCRKGCEDRLGRRVRSKRWTVREEVVNFSTNCLRCEVPTKDRRDEMLAAILNMIEIFGKTLTTKYGSFYESQV